MTLCIAISLVFLLPCAVVPELRFLIPFPALALLTAAAYYYLQRRLGKPGKRAESPALLAFILLSAAAACILSPVLLLLEGTPLVLALVGAAAIYVLGAHFAIRRAVKDLKHAWDDGGE